MKNSNNTRPSQIDSPTRALSESTVILLQMFLQCYRWFTDGAKTTPIEGEQPIRQTSAVRSLTSTRGYNVLVHVYNISNSSDIHVNLASVVLVIGICCCCNWINMYLLATMMRPRLAVELTDEQIIWAGLKHFFSHFRCGFTIIYGHFLWKC